MGYHLTFARRYAKDFKRLSDINKKHVNKALDELMKDPHYPALRTKHLHSESDLFESSVNMDIRLLWCYQGDEEIEVLEVGHHDVLDRYAHEGRHER